MSHTWPKSNRENDWCLCRRAKPHQTALRRFRIGLYARMEADWRPLCARGSAGFLRKHLSSAPSCCVQTKSSRSDSLDTMALPCGRRVARGASSRVGQRTHTIHPPDDASGMGAKERRGSAVVRCCPLCILPPPRCQRRRPPVCQTFSAAAAEAARRRGDGRAAARVRRPPLLHEEQAENPTTLRWAHGGGAGRPQGSGGSVHHRSQSLFFSRLGHVLNQSNICFANQIAQLLPPSGHRCPVKWFPRTRSNWNGLGSLPKMGANGRHPFFGGGAGRSLNIRRHQSAQSWSQMVGLDINWFRPVIAPQPQVFLASWGQLAGMILKK